MIPGASTHLVLIPSYNTGAKLFDTVRGARRYWKPVWVVVDGSTDGSGEELKRMAESDPDLRLLVLPRNRGKGAAILNGLNEAKACGFTHVLTMDADGQHPAHCIPEFMAASMANPDAVILGMPVFDDSVPRLRLGGRRLSNWWANLETFGVGIGDSLFGFRVYPVAHLCAVMGASRWMRRFDFDPEAAVRLCWRGLRPINLPAPVKYFRREEGGVSHFNYWRDNALLTWMHMRLFLGFVARMSMLRSQRLRSLRR